METETIYSNPEPRTSTPDASRRETRSRSPTASIISDRRTKSKKQDDEAIYDHLDETDRRSDRSASPENALEKLRRGKFTAGTNFRAKGNFQSQEDGDLTIRKDEILRFVQRNDDDWWLFENAQGERGLVPINFIEPCAPVPLKLSPPARPAGSSLTIEAWNRTGEIPSGFVASQLGPLSRSAKYKLFDKLRPLTGASNLFLTHLHWNYNDERIAGEPVDSQRFVYLQERLRIPRIKTDHIEILCRCLRICLTDETKIVSNIHSMRAFCDDDDDDDDDTETWSFEKPTSQTLIEHHSKLLLRSNRTDKSSTLFLLMELCQICRSKTSGERCEIGCGWLKIPLDLSKSQSYDELIAGGRIDEPNVLLDQRYQQLRSDGLRGKLHRRRRARLKFKVEFCDKDDEKLPFSHLPTTSIVVPSDLIVLLAFYRNELAFQCRQKICTKPIDSVLLGTFAHALDQPDLLFPFLHRARSKKKFDFQRLRKKFLQIYESFVYPLLSHVRLSRYDFAEETIINARATLINERIRNALTRSRRENNLPDPAEIFLDPESTTNFKAFDLAELTFSFEIEKKLH